MRWRRALIAGTMLLSISNAARAHGDANDDPAAVYDRGASAYDRGDYRLAAKELAHADGLAPNPVTLELALGAALRTDDAVLAMTLAERASERPGSKSLDALAQSAKKRLASKVGKLKVACRAGGPCDVTQVTLDGRPFDAGAPRVVAIGPHKVVVKRGRDEVPFDVTIEPGQQVELIAGSTPAPILASPTPSQGERSRGLSPTWFWVGLGLSAIVDGAAIVSGVDTVSKHDTFAADRSDAGAAAAGRASETRTVVLISASAVLAVGTAALGLFFVDLRGRHAQTVAAGLF